MGAYLVKPNEHEFATIVGKPKNKKDMINKGKELKKSLDLTALLLTLGKSGMILFDKNSVITFPTSQKEVYDVTGAGDTVISVLAASLSSDKTLKKSCELANIAAGLSIQHLGTVSVSKSDIQMPYENNKLITNVEDLNTSLSHLKKIGKSIVFTNGCFDIIHPGHIHLLTSASSKGDVLVVGLNSDQSIKNFKSKNRPICPQYDRAFVVGALSCVDFIIIFDEDTPEELIKKIEPDVLVKGSDYNNKFIAGADFMLEKKKRVELVSLLEHKSTTDIISRIKKQGS